MSSSKHLPNDAALDGAIMNSKAVKLSLRNASNLVDDLQYATLLRAIVANSNNELDTKYIDIDDGVELVSTNEELRSQLDTAWKAKSFREIRNLGYLKATKSSNDWAKTRTHLSRSFRADYWGAAVDGFHEYLTQNEGLFKTKKQTYYAKFCSVVQSSGTGKSRMLIELFRKDVIIIYVNLRPLNDTLSFPPRDEIPSEILTQFPKTQEKYQTVCFAFFTALFKTLDDHLRSKGDIQNWVEEMCDMRQPAQTDTRDDFFKHLKAKYGEEYAYFGHESAQSEGDEGHSPLDPDTTVLQTAKMMQQLSISAESKSRPQVPPTYTGMLSVAFMKLAERLGEIFPHHGDKPKLVIAIDEAHPLTPMEYGYRPADIFCRVVNEYSYIDKGAHAVWVAFASTTSKVGDFSPPNQIHNSHRVSTKGFQLFPPYTQLGWDQSAWALGTTESENVSQLEHIIGFGRPLWGSLKISFENVRELLSTASSKLRGKDMTFDFKQNNHVLAVLGQRFVLNIAYGHPESVAHLENGVASHMLVCLGTTIDRTWRFTRYPSEPLLSCAAADVLHEDPARLGDALGTLVNIVNSGMIDQGQRGELASRLLWLLAKDLFIRDQAKKDGAKPLSGWKDHLMDCQMIRVVDWLEFVFGPRMWTGGHKQARKSFENAYLNFSHWVPMDGNIASKEENGLSLYEFTLRHWYRTSAVQCCHQQPMIDKMIPIYLKDQPGTISKKPRLSQIFISDKARESTSSKDALCHITRRHESIGSPCQGGRSDPDEESIPYISILADLGQPSSFSMTFPEREIEDRCMRIYAAGVDVTTYPFLANHPAFTKALQDLVHIQQVPETERPITEYLNDQLKFSSTSSREHMFWEQGKSVPTVRGQTKGS